jgi:coniferyl-aldehyde dehydrogenase
MYTTTQELDRLFASQKAAFASNSMPTLDERLERLRRLEGAMMQHRKGFQESVAADFGSHSPMVTDLFETGGVLGRNRYIQAMLAEWMMPSERPLNAMVHGSSTGRVIRQPKGVIGNLAPFNFPIECALVMVNDMIAAGNRVIVKASEQTPATSRNRRLPRRSTKANSLSSAAKISHSPNISAPCPGIIFASPAAAPPGARCCGLQRRI